MLSSLIDIFVSRGFPSAVVLVGAPRGSETQCSLLHIMPEDGSFERHDICFTERVFRNNASERSREQIGTIAVARLGDRAGRENFLNDVQARALQRWKQIAVSSPSQHEDAEGKSKASSKCGYIVDVPQLVDDILRPAAVVAMREWEKLVSRDSTTVREPVYIVYVKRSKPGRIINFSCF
ncbi:hypothetical protein C8Q77DRAFT_655482 [Trametes polyzona]|nr:hypothetical protein C8Q77DRAFT_655482 [Trametes polyzona]